MGETEAPSITKPLQKLLAELRTVQAREYEITEEIVKLVNGGHAPQEQLREVMGHFDHIWCVRYAPGQTKRYVWTFAKDIPHVKRLLKALTPAELKDRMTNYLRNNDDFYVKCRHSFAAFVASVNSHAPRQAVERVEDNPWTEICRILDTLVTRHEFYQWLKPLEFVEATESLIVVRCPNELYRDWITKHYVQDIEQARKRRQELRHVQFVLPEGQ